MDSHRFDRLVRSLALPRSRRGIMLALVGGIVATTGAETAQARRRKCRAIGNRCRDNQDCCSGKCKGTRRNSRCAGHDSGGCRAGNTACRTPPETRTTSLGEVGGCLTTTGDGGYCCDNCSVGTACAGPRA